MTERLKRPLRRQIQARVMGVLNVPTLALPARASVRVLLGLPFPTPLNERLMLISFTGRKTGNR